MLELKGIYKTFNRGTVNEKGAINGLDLKLEDGENAAASFRAALGLGDASIPAHKAVHDRIRALLATLSQSKE